ncbi:MAG: hypothetical protein HN909_02050 [Phycisphaerales bacterium]|nr:hypothetical protein [Phycisphaerales bacterium]MBT7170532.1 hypothetical protein [Phycisphaerales bacterium]
MHMIPWGETPDAPLSSSPHGETIRWSLILRTRRQIEAGTYNIDAKLDEALDVVYDEITQGQRR